MHDDELTPEEREAFHALPRETRPADLLEERIVRALAAGGFVRSRRHFPAPLAWASAAAACAVFFVAGFATGQSRAPRVSTGALVQSPADTGLTATGRARPALASDVTLVTADSNRATGTQYVVWF